MIWMEFAESYPAAFWGLAIAGTFGVLCIAAHIAEVIERNWRRWF